MTPCSPTAALIRCARNNTLSGIPCIIVLTFALVVFHKANIPAAERLISAGIGATFGWCFALWGAVVVVKYPQESDPKGANSVSDDGKGLTPPGNRKPNSPKPNK